MGSSNPGGDRDQQGSISDEDMTDADLLAFNVEMGMVPINSSGGLSSNDLEGTALQSSKPRRQRLHSHSVPLAEEGGGDASAMHTRQRAASQDLSDDGGPAITASGALFDYFTGSQDAWDNASDAVSGGNLSTSNSSSNISASAARRRGSRGSTGADAVIHKYVIPLLFRLTCY